VPIERLPAGTSTATCCEQVAEAELDYALVESTRYTLARRFFPTLDVAFNMASPWITRGSSPPSTRRSSLDAAGRSSSGIARTAR
jgi:membrane-bound lytic murein transglycosylase MltF